MGRETLRSNPDTPASFGTAATYGWISAVEKEVPHVEVDANPERYIASFKSGLFPGMG